MICSRDRASQLHRCLTALEQIRTSINWECIVVDNGSTDDTSKIVRDWSLKAKIPVTLLYEGIAGTSRAKNLGWRHAKGKIITFTDDDCYLDPNMLSDTFECFKESDIAFLGGRVLLHDPDDYPITIQTLNQRIDIPPESFIRAGLIHGANFSFTRESLEAVDGFDNHFGAGTPFPCEDVDLMARISFHGYWGAYDPKPFVYHHHNRKTKEQAKSLMNFYDCGRGAYYAKAINTSKMRWIYIKRWLVSARRNPKRFYRELVGAIRYLQLVYKKS